MAEKFKEYRKTGYLVGTRGTVLSPYGKILTSWFINSGYLCVSLLLPKLVAKTVHSLVAEVWIGKRPVGQDVNHKDGNKLNNRFKNLEYTTKSGNMLHASKFELLPRAEKHCMATIDNAVAEQICKLIVQGKRNSYIATAVGTNASIVRDIRACKSWTSVSKKYFSKTIVIAKATLPISKRVRLIKFIVSGTKTRKELSHKFGLSPQMISDIKYHRTWADAWEVFKLSQ